MLEFRAVPLPPVVPGNLLPAALPEILDVHSEGSGRGVRDALTAFFHKTGQEDGLGGLSHAALGLSGAKLLEEGSLKTRLTELGADMSRPVTFGPREQAAGDAAVRDLIVPQVSGTTDDASEPVQVGIIDAGIAFWNPAFSDRFATFGGLVFGAGRSTLHETLAPSDMQDMIARGKSRAGDRHNRSVLAERLPGSVFDTSDAEQPLFPADGFAHGTAMTELVLCEAPRNTPLHGLELPKSVLRDLTGGQMRAVLDAALRAVVNQAAGHMDDGSTGCPPFRMVVLLAFGFLGGPHDSAMGEPDMFTTLRETLDAYARKGIEIELVVPMGNHLQHQAYADLHGGKELGWRLLPDDHSANTLEFIHSSDKASLCVLAPCGRAVTLDIQQEGVGQLVLNGVPVGAVWSQALSKPGWIRTRLCLAPTVAHDIAVPTAPFGRWTVSMPEDQSAQVWVMRDETGFEADPRRPARGSWLEDDAYRERNDIGMPPIRDPIDYEGMVRRAGTASLLSAFDDPRVVTVGAQWRDGREGDCHGAPYSGASLNGGAPNVALPLGTGLEDVRRPIGPFGQRAVLGNGSDLRFRAAGTSLTAALAAGQRAARQSSLNAVT